MLGKEKAPTIYSSGGHIKPFLSISLKAVIKPPTDHMQMVDEEELMELEPITPPIS